MCKLHSIRLIRRRLDISLNQLAHIAGIAPASLSRLELGLGATRHEAHVREVLTRIEREKDARPDRANGPTNRHASAD